MQTQLVSDGQTLTFHSINSEGPWGKVGLLSEFLPKQVLKQYIIVIDF